MRHLIDICDLSVNEINDLIDTANDIIKNSKKYINACKGKKLATLFYEPSTRTRLSFEAAMYELGGNIIGFSDSGSSSATKGETVYDTIKMINSYADIVAIRHPYAGAARIASKAADIPIINAGDGSNKHPTQTLADLLTISKEKGRLDNLTIGLCGDLKFGRTIHSLVDALLRYPNIKLIFISPKALEFPYDIESCTKTTGLGYAIPQLDVLYMTRVQQERFDSKDEYNALKDTYILDNDKLKKAKKDLCILHPLPRVNEIASEVDTDPRAKYFKQAMYGKYIRMALILFLTTQATKDDHPYETNNNYICRNNKCITKIERGIQHEFINDSCIYCGERAK